jgi:superfamily I DNA and RNA helicase
MTYKILTARLSQIIKEVARLDQENPTGPDEESDPRIEKLLDEALRIQKALDIIVREVYRNSPEKLAEWERIIQIDDED